MEKRYQLEIEGMGCAHCVKSVTEALTQLGAAVEQCTIGSATVLFDGKAQEMQQAITERGFRVTEITEE